MRIKPVWMPDAVMQALR